MIRNKFASITIAALLAPAVANAAQVYNTPVTPTKANGDFISGSGIPANGFAIDTNPGSGVSVALKARSRDTGQPISIVNDIYTVQNGLALDGVNPSWVFDLQFSPGNAGTIADAYRLDLSVDFNPAAGAEQFVTLGATIPTPPFISTANPGPGAWSNDAVDFVVSDSSHLGFNFWNLFPHTAFNPNATGEYVVKLEAKDSVGTPVASTAITVVSVPEPASFGLLAIAGAAVLMRRRPRRK